MPLARLLPHLPLPVAQIAYRALAAKSPAEAHFLADAIGETTLRLCAASRLAIWLAKGSCEGPTRRALEAIATPTTSCWLALLAAADEELGARSDRAILPLTEVHGKLHDDQSWPAVVTLADAMTARKLVPDERAADVRSKGLSGFFRLIEDYRPDPDHADAAGDDLIHLWHAALEEVLDCPQLWGDGWAPGKTSLVVRLPDGRWLKLAGKEGIVFDPPNRERAERAVAAGELCLMVPGAALRLHPFAVYRHPEIGGEQVAFLHRVEPLDGAGPAGPLTYFDFATGQVSGETEARAAVQDLVSLALGGAQPAPPMLALARVPEPERAAPLAHTLRGFLGPRVGATFHGLQIERILGTGGSEWVYLAVQLSTRRRVVLKVLRDAGKAAEERFRRGLVALGRCDHDHVVRVLTAELEKEPAHYTMEYVHGVDLRRLAHILGRFRAEGTRLEPSHVTRAIEQGMAATGPEQGKGAAGAVLGPPAGEAFYRRLAALFAGGARGLAHLHEQKVVHRDVKPSNLVLTADGRRLVLIDFGIARPLDASRAVTEEGHVPVGTLAYMAPECLAGDPDAAGPRSDIYSFGLTLYELAVGRRLIEADDSTALRRAYMTTTPSAQTAAPELPESLASILDKALDRDPARRYATAGEIAEDLEACAEGRPLLHARPRGLAARLRDAVRRQPQAVAAGVVLVAVVTAAVAVVRWELHVTVTVCTEIVERFGAPECLEPTPDGSADAWYRIESQAGRVIRMLRQDASGHPLEETSGPEQGVAEWRFEYGEDHPIGGFGLDSQGKRVHAWSYQKGAGGAHDVDKKYTVNDSPEEGSRLTLDANGYVVEERFQTAVGGERTDETGAKGYRYSRDARGKVKKVPIGSP